MKELTKETVAGLTSLSRIHCGDEDLEALAKDLKKIFDYFETLEEIDTEGVRPCNHVLEGMVNVSREDIPSETLPRKVFLDNAPSHTGGLIRVPPVFNKED